MRKLTGLEVVAAATAETEWVAASFRAELAVIVLGREEALETSKIILLESVQEREDTLVFPLLFSLVTRMKATSLASGISTAISILGEDVGIGLEP